MFTKSEQEIRQLGFTADFIYFLSRIVIAAFGLELSAMLSWAQNQNKKGGLDQPDARKHWAQVKILRYCYPKQPTFSTA